MPDWTYHPLLRPTGIFFHGGKTRAVTLGHLRRIGSTAPGRWLIRTMGHADLPETLAITKAGITFPGPVMLNSNIDPHGIASRALAQLQFAAIQVDDASAPLDNHTLLVQPLNTDTAHADVVRCAASELDAASAGRKAPLVDVTESTTDEQLLQCASRAFIIENTEASTLATTQRVRNLLGPDALIAAGGYVNTPRQAVALRDAGADVIVVGDGLAISGPGIAKRIAEALTPYDAPDATPSQWIPATMFSIGAIVAGLIATYLSFTSVILDYDTKFVGLNRAQIEAVNPHLLDFMRHDRLSYAGATLSVGVFYFALAFFGIRKRQRWAFHTYAVAGAFGFITAGLFVLYGYFDRGNMAVASVLAPFFIASLLRRPSFVPYANRVDLDNDRAWRHGHVGQLLLAALAIGLLIGGAIICGVGGTHVFVISDLAFLDTTSHAIHASNSRLAPLIAHDRVSFGGSIVCNGLALLLISLWGYKRGARWAWWSILIAGTTNLGFTLYAHFSAGYLEFGHLVPVFLGAWFFIVGLILSYAYLCDSPNKQKRRSA